MAFITNFQGPVEIEDLIERFKIDGLTNLDKIYFNKPDETEWTVDKDALIGDTVFFMCAKTSVDHMGHVRAQAKKTDDKKLNEYAEKQYQNYRQFAGTIVAIGTVADLPFQEDDPGYHYAHWKSPWYAAIRNVIQLQNPVSIDSFRDFITVSRTGAITRLTAEQENKLLAIIQERNDFPKTETPPDYPFLSPIQLFEKYIDLVFAVDTLWDNFQYYVREAAPNQDDRFFAYHRDPQCIDIWLQMLDNMGGGWPMSLFASTAFLLLSYKEQGHDLDAELALIKKLRSGSIF